MPSNSKCFSDRVKIFVAGSINIDHMYQCPQLPKAGQCVINPSYSKQIGGKGLNQAFALFQAAVDVNFHGFVGHDGQWIIEHLKSAGFPFHNIQIQEEMMTGTVVILMREDIGDENATMLYLGANASFSSEKFEKFISQAEAGDFVLFQNEMNRVGSFIEAAKCKGLTTVFNPAPHPPKCSAAEWKSEYQTDILILNYSEALMILENFGISGVESVESIMEALRDGTGCGMVVLTKGGDGSFALTKDEFMHQPAIQRSDMQIIDTTGAGDAFLGYFISVWISTGDLGKALKEANAAGFLAITRAGTMVSIPCREQVEAFMSE